MDDKAMEHNHDFDGIEELDNDLPRWWLGIFWVSMALAIFYVPYYHFMHPEKLPTNAWDAENSARTAAVAVAEAEQPKIEDEEAVLWAGYDAGGWLDAAKTDFGTYCMPCHAPDGGGTIGPNFTDDYYLHGGKLSDIKRTITEGVIAKGMVPWKGTLKPEQIQNLAFYIRSLRGTTPAVPKAPEGKLVDEKGEFVEGDGDTPVTEEPQPEPTQE